MKIFIKANTIDTTPQGIAKYISQKSDLLAKEPVGNQNCMLCTWAAEQRLRGVDATPRAVYSPRDPIFEVDPKAIVNNSDIISDLTAEKLKESLEESGNGSRFYVHVNWAESSGGHEFLALNDNDEVYILDAQSGIYAPLDSNEGSEYFDDINSANSYAFRIDDRELNKDYLELNNDEYLVDWDEEADIKFMEDEGMI